MEEQNDITNIIDLVYEKSKKENKLVDTVIEELIEKIKKSNFNDEEKGQALEILKIFKYSNQAFYETDENGHIVICRLSSDYHKNWYNKDNTKRGDNNVKHT